MAVRYYFFLTFQLVGVTTWAYCKNAVFARRQKEAKTCEREAHNTGPILYFSSF